MKFYHLKLVVLVLMMLKLGNVFSYNKDIKIPQLTQSAQISLLTVGCADDEVWQNFGHTAIRIKDSILGWDLVYNYGTFDFGEPNFVMKFIKRQLLYYESIDSYAAFKQMYIEENRTIQEQILNLNQQQKQTLFERLTINAREENKYYIYDFLFDNCSTRPRDIILSLFKTKNFKQDKDDASSFRELIDRNVHDEWLDFGMDLLIGVPTDKEAKFGRTFLPDELMQTFDNATVDGKPLVKSNKLILDKIPEHKSKQWLTPGLAFWLLFFVILVLQVRYDFFNKQKWFVFLYFTILGLLGYLCLFMWFFTDHLCTKWNLNILWAMPLNIPLVYFLLKKNKPTFAISFIKFYRILLIVLLIAWWANPQTYHVAVIPLILIAILFSSLYLPVPTKEDFKKRLFS
ncbi:MAG: DUF4105 domain-containing protein [Bacteroidetes bacterium]|nr:DUF4105 domain-containing protein [Bacteroidota bacterium]